MTSGWFAVGVKEPPPFNNTPTVAKSVIRTATSGRPSPSKSPTATPSEYPPELKLATVTKCRSRFLTARSQIQEKGTTVCRCIHNQFDATRSCLPSPSTSAINDRIRVEIRRAAQDRLESSIAISPHDPGIMPAHECQIKLAVPVYITHSEPQKAGVSVGVVHHRLESSIPISQHDLRRFPSRR